MTPEEACEELKVELRTAKDIKDLSKKLSGVKEECAKLKIEFKVIKALRLENNKLRTELEFLKVLSDLSAQDAVRLEWLNSRLDWTLCAWAGEKKSPKQTAWGLASGVLVAMRGPDKPTSLREGIDSAMQHHANVKEELASEL